MKTQAIERLVSPWAKRGSEESTLVRRAVHWGLMVLLPVLIVGSLTTPRAFAQAAQISGLITDSSGARLPNANVTVANRDTGISRSVDSNTDGFYSVPLLQPGNYMITAKSAGFATQIHTGITLEVGAQQVLNLTLQVGQMNQTVEVNAEAPIVELTSSALTATVNSTTVRELPLNGRSWTDLATLQPGVDAIQTQVSFSAGADRGNRGFGSQVSISGARPQQNNYRVDGISINDYSNGAPGSVLGGNLGVDAIEEFSVLTSNYSAEYGRTSGGVVNAITRSGTNQFHGAAYEFLRNNALDAANFFDNANGIQKPPFKRNQFGITAGGPIRKDKMFVFGDYEGIRQSKGTTIPITVPSNAARNGTLCSVPDNPPDDPANPCTPTPIPSKPTPGVVDASVKKYLPFWPVSATIQPGTNGDIASFAFPAQQVVTENFFTIRGDHKLSDKDSVFATFLFDNTLLTQPDGLENILLGFKTLRQLAVLEESHIFSPGLVNSVRFGFNRAAADNDYSAKAINPLAADRSLGAVQGQEAAAVKVTGLTDFTGGLGANPNVRFRWNTFQVYDDAFLTHGVHSLKFGVAVERMQFNQLQPANPSGQFTFSTLQDFLTNQPRRFQKSFVNGLTPRDLRQTLFGLYLQDDWRALPNLTLNLGLRYEITTVPTEVHGRLATLVNLTDAIPHLGNPYFLNPTLRNLEPRVGFAWDPFRDGKTAVRGGFGLFDVLPLPYEFQHLAAQAAPFFELGQATDANLLQGSFFTGALALLGPTSFREAFIEHKPPRNYVMQWNFNVQRELASNISMMVAYVGSRGVHQPFRSDDVDMVLPKSTPEGYLWPSPLGSGETINPNFGAIRGLMWAGNSVYHALEVGITKKMSRGFQVQGSYTWGKSIDTSSTTAFGDSLSNSIASLHWFDLKLSRAPSDFNIGRKLVINGTWQVPRANTLSAPIAWVVNGWELGGIFELSDGVPFSPLFGAGGDPLGLNSNDPWDFPNRLTGPGCNSLVNPGNPNKYIKTECFAPPTAPASFFYPAVATPLCTSDPQLNVLYGAGTTDGNGTPPQCFNLRGNAGRNILIGPGTSNLDFSVFKNNPIKKVSENFTMQFRAEFFNILNRANFAVPVTPDNVTIFDSTGALLQGIAGNLTSTTTTAREIQFAIKLVW